MNQTLIDNMVKSFICMNEMIKKIEDEQITSFLRLFDIPLDGYDGVVTIKSLLKYQHIRIMVHQHIYNQMNISKLKLPKKVEITPLMVKAYHNCYIFGYDEYNQS